MMINLPNSELTLNGTLVRGETVNGITRIRLPAGVFRNFHEVKFRSTMQGFDAAVSNATPVDVSGASTGVPRVLFAKPGNKRLHWFEDVPAGWTEAGINFDWCKEAAGVGNVHWRIEMQLLPFLGTHDLDDGAMTQVFDTGVAVPATQGNGVYTITNTDFATTPQAFAIPQMLHCCLTRVDDGVDTFAGAVAAAFTSLSLTD